MAAYTRELARAVALNELKAASGVTASALRSLETMRDNAMTGVDSGRAVVGSSAGGQSASFQIDMTPSQRVVLFQAAIDILTGARVSRTTGSFTNVSITPCWDIGYSKQISLLQATYFHCLESRDFFR